MTPLHIVWCVVAALVVFGLVEGVMLGALISFELVGTACGARLLPHQRARLANLCPRLAKVGLFLGHVCVGVVTPYAVLALLAPRPEWLVSLATSMAVASGASGGLALLAGFLAGLLSSPAGLPRARPEGAAVNHTIACGRPRATPQEAA